MMIRQFFATMSDLGYFALCQLALRLRETRWSERPGWLFVLGGFLGICVTLLSFVAAISPIQASMSAVSNAPADARRPSWPLLLQAPIRQDVMDALAQMTEQELSQAYVDVHFAFENSLGSSYLGAARNLIDYAFLAERELALRELARPMELPSPRDMLRLFEQLL